MNENAVQTFVDFPAYDFLNQKGKSRDRDNDHSDVEVSGTRASQK